MSTHSTLVRHWAKGPSLWSFYHGPFPPWPPPSLPAHLPPPSSSLTVSHSPRHPVPWRSLRMAFSLSGVVCSLSSYLNSLSPTTKMNLTQKSFPRSRFPMFSHHHTHNRLGYVSCSELTMLSNQHDLGSGFWGIVTGFVLLIAISMAYIRPAFTGMAQIRCMSAWLFPLCPSSIHWREFCHW